MNEAVIAAVIIIGLVALFATNAIFRIIIYLLVALALVALFFRVFVKKYDETERAIIFRMGKFNRVAGPGWAIVIPFFEKEYAKVDVRTKMMNIHIPVAFTKDDLRVEMSGIFYYKIINPEKAILNVESYQLGLNNIIISETRNAMASMSMRELFANLGKLNDILKDKIRQATWKWGVDVNMVQIKGIVPPMEIAVAMQQKEIAAQQLQAQRFRAEAKKVTLEAIGEAAKKLDDYSIMYLYLEALKEIGKGQSTKIIFPARFLSILDKMKSNMGTALAGLNVSNMVNAVKDKILESKKD